MSKEQLETCFEGDIDLDNVSMDYPFRPTRTNRERARCGFCKFNAVFYNDGEFFGNDCTKGHKIKYPTQVTEHSCQDYQYLEDTKIEEIPDDKIKMFLGLIDKMPECGNCGHNFKNHCDGIKWYEFERRPICQFFIDKDLTCKYAVPFFQYGNHIRNNYCRLNPELRSDLYAQCWECCCVSAHKKPKYLKCYTPKKEVKNDSN